MTAKRKGRIIAAAVLLIILCLGAYRYYSRPDGITVESREEMLRGTPKGIEWNIARERELNGYILSGIYGGNKAGIAVFEPTGSGKYRLVSREWRNADQIITSGFFDGGERYDVIWFNGAPTSRAEMRYTIDGAEAEPLVFDTSSGEIICEKAPAKDYELNVKYYDSDGNVYE